MSLIKTLIRKLSKQTQTRKKAIIVGIDTPSYQLAQQLIAQHSVEVIAFIDDEPWSNRTELLGSTVRYPSDICALIERKAVDVLIYFKGQIIVQNATFVEVGQLGTDIIQLEPTQTVNAWVEYCEKHCQA